MTDVLPDKTLRDDFIRALAEDFAAHGVAAIVAYREDKPADYLKNHCLDFTQGHRERCAEIRQRRRGGFER